MNWSYSVLSQHHSSRAQSRSICGCECKTWAWQQKKKKEKRQGNWQIKWETDLNIKAERISVWAERPDSVKNVMNSVSYSKVNYDRRRKQRPFCQYVPTRLSSWNKAQLGFFFFHLKVPGWWFLETERTYRTRGFVHREKRRTQTREILLQKIIPQQKLFDVFELND